MDMYIFKIEKILIQKNMEMIIILERYHLRKKVFMWDKKILSCGVDCGVLHNGQEKCETA